MAAPEMTYEYAHSAAWDAGTRSMRAAGRDRWNEDDWNAAVATFNALYGATTTDGNHPAENHQED